MDWLGDHLWSAWLALAILLGIAEMFSLDLILGMLALGALVGVLSSALGAGLALSAILAALAALATLTVVRPPLVQRLHSGPDLKQGHAKLIGERGRVTERISGLEPGRIRVGGDIWTAKPYDEDLSIEPGATVEIFEIRGATAYVHPIPSIES